MNAALTPAERKAAERQRHRDAGRVVVQVWLQPLNREKLARYVKRLNQRSEQTNKEQA